MMEFLECSAGIFFQRLVIKCFRYLNFRYNFSVIQAVFSRQPLSHLEIRVRGKHLSNIISKGSRFVIL